AVRRRTLNGVGSAISEKPAVGLELVALGVSPEVIVIVENKNAGRGPPQLAEKVRSGKSADASAHNHQVISLAAVGGFSGLLPESSIAQAMGRLEGPGVAAAEAGQSRRIVIGR